MNTIYEFAEVDPNKKNGEWANKMVTEYRRHWQPLVDTKTAQVNMEMLLSAQPMTNVKSMFRKPEETKLSFARVAVMEKYRNILIAERDKAGVQIGLNSIDPTVVEADRQHDRDLLANRKMIEAAVSTLRAKIGDPPMKINNERFKGNVKSFDEIGLNDEEDEDLNYFFSTHWRLLQEITGELPINHFFKHNKVASNITMWCNDILAKKAIGAQVNLNQQSGVIDVGYLAPEQIKIIWGAKQDCTDAQAIGYDKNVTIQELLRHLGSDFDATTDFAHLMSTINSSQARTFTGLTNESGQTVWNDQSKNYERNCNWSTFMNFKVTLGYIEFKSIDATGVKVGTTRHGNPAWFLMNNFSQELESEYYTKETLYNEVTYKAYYVPSGTQTQKLYKFGKLYHQTTEGGEDEYSNYSICAYKETGPSAVEVCKPYVDMIQQAWTKFEWMVRKAKPKGRTYNYEALVQIATNMISKGDNASKVASLLEKFEEGINDIYTIPTIGGEKVGGGVNPYFDKPNGLDASAKDFLETITWCNERLASDLAVNAIREAYSPAANDGYKLQMEALEQSRNATQYISTMLLNVLGHVGAQTLLICQAIIRYKTSKAYKYLVRALGQDTVNALEQCKFAHHRLGIFIDTFNRDKERQEIKQLTMQAYANKEIDLAQTILINAIDSFKKAGEILAYEKRRQEKIKKQEQEALHEQQMQQIEAKTNGELAIIDRKGDWTNQAKNIEGEWFYKAHKANADAIIQKKEMDEKASLEKISAKTDGDIEKSAAEKNMEHQRSLV